MPLNIISSTLVPASSYDLTDLATVKDELKIPWQDTSADAFLGRAITQVSGAIANYCNRTFVIETIQDVIYPERDAYPYQVPGGVDRLMLSRFPVIALPLTAPVTATVSSGLTLPFVSTAGISVGQPVGNHASIQSGATVTAIASGSVTISLPLTGVVLAGDAVTFGLIATVAETPATLLALVHGASFRIDQAKGWLLRLDPRSGYPCPWPPLVSTVTYQAGFSAVPSDIVEATLRTVTGRFAGRGRDPLLKRLEQQGLGMQEYWVGTLPGVTSGFTQEIADLIDNYRVPVNA